jgi:hypothetical protein
MSLLYSRGGNFTTKCSKIRHVLTALLTALCHWIAIFQRGRLRKNNMARVSFRWEQIGEIRFSPGGPHHTPKMRIIPIDDAVYIVVRDKFMGSEQHIVEVLRAHGAGVLVESKLH